ncbi:MAG TPA: helix-turn-helix transcriptional regulator [Candidatus Gastranaerophilales bacterium]|nr:helix-turn-helix transcriptional regulator [Candidatus Gastranaerophilales bacterium]
MKIGEKLRILRKKLDNINQIDFAKKLGISLKTYQNYEASVHPVKLDTINALIREFKVNPNWLFLNKGSVFLNSEETSSFTPDEYWKDGYDLTDYELELIKEQFLSSSNMKKAVLKLLRAKAKKHEALSEIESIVKDLAESV